MISIIICSRKADISEELRNNISSTIGCDYELLVIDNSRNDYNIFTAYNEGVSRAKGDILCFMHDDVLFHSSDWGKRVEQHFEDNSIGCVGVFGGHAVPKRPAYWNDVPLWSGKYIALDSTHQDYIFIEDNYVDESGCAEVAVSDGVFLCIPKRLFDEHIIRWDDTLGGFHIYDMDICLQLAAKGYKVIVDTNILLEHCKDYPEGKIDVSFIEAKQKCFEKWQSQLPVVRGIPQNKFDNLLRYWTYFDFRDDAQQELNRIKHSGSYLLTHYPPLQKLCQTRLMLYFSRIIKKGLSKRQLRAY